MPTPHPVRLAHRTDASRVGAITPSRDAAGKYVLLVQHTDASGKSRKKSLKDTNYFPWDKAMRFALREGYVLPAPQEGPLRWLTHTQERYPHGGPSFALDRTRDAVWVADTGFIRKITRGTCEQHDIAIGDEVMPRGIGCSSDGQVYAVLDLVEGATKGTPPFAAPTAGKKHSFGLVRVTDDLRIETIAEVPAGPQSEIFDNVSVSNVGLVCAPHADGVGLYRDDGTVEATYSVRRSKYDSPKAAISPNARYVALGRGDGVVRRIDRKQDTTEDFEAGLSQLHGLQVFDDGLVAARGHRDDEGWGAFLLSPGEPPRRVGEPHARLAADRETVVELEAGTLTWRATEGLDVRCKAYLPVLGMAKSGDSAFWNDSTLIVRTDVFTLAELDLDALREETVLDEAVLQATTRGDVAEVQSLLEARPTRLTARDAQLQTLLHRAVQTPHVEVTRALLRSGAGIDEQAAAGATPIHLACAEQIPVLIEAGAKVDRPDHAFDMPLHYQARRSDGLAAVEVLLQAGADATIANMREQTPLSIAEARGDDALVAVLRQHLGG